MSLYLRCDQQGSLGRFGLYLRSSIPSPSETTGDAWPSKFAEGVTASVTNLTFTSMGKWRGPFGTLSLLYSSLPWSWLLAIQLNSASLHHPAQREQGARRNVPVIHMFTGSPCARALPQEPFTRETGCLKYFHLNISKVVVAFATSEL